MSDFAGFEFTSLDLLIPKSKGECGFAATDSLKGTIIQKFVSEADNFYKDVTW